MLTFGTVPMVSLLKNWLISLLAKELKFNIKFKTDIKKKSSEIPGALNKIIHNWF